MKIGIFPKNGIHCLMFEKQTIGSYVFYYYSITISLIIIVITIIIS